MSPAPPTFSLDIRLELGRFTLEVRETIRSRRVAFYGASGAGKTTMVETIAGLRPQVAGSVHFLGEEWQDSALARFVPPERRGLGFVPQQSFVLPHLTVRRNILLGPAVEGDGAREREALLGEVCGALSLTPLLDERALGLSGGEQQRVALARALCRRGRLLLLDEPVSFLDGDLRHAALRLILAQLTRQEIPLVLISHDPKEVAALCDEVLVIRDGRVAERGRPADLLDGEEFPSLSCDHPDDLAQ